MENSRWIINEDRRVAVIYITGAREARRMGAC
jgi:hypothetical protein